MPVDGYELFRKDARIPPRPKRTGYPALILMKKYIASIKDLDRILGETEFLKEYRMLCTEIRQDDAHALSSETEDMIGRLSLSGAMNWSKLSSYLTSTLMVDYDGEKKPLSAIRGMAGDESKAVRKKAYEAELASYDKVKDSMAFALNSIKNQYATIASARGYESPLAMTLSFCRMKKETLDAMFAAMDESLPVFHRYLKAKARLLGYEGALPFHDLFAPLPGAHKPFSIEEARDYLVHVFSGFSEDMAGLMAEAFDHEWIDFLAHGGKSGGACCINLAGYDQSRILTNFTFDMDGVTTLAHELGHAYHDRMIRDRRILNQDYPMPIAETASIFNEIHLSLYALAHADSDTERLGILEPFLQGNTQTICDIYSRFLFEHEVMNRCQSEFLMPDKLCEIMLKAQKKAYGDGMDENYLHPYMWCCKPHYYISGFSYYNFPYAFGNMLALGLYSRYLENKEAFLPAYRKLLGATPLMTLEDVAALADIDLTDKNFWKSSLTMVATFVEEFEALASKQQIQ